MDLKPCPFCGSKRVYLAWSTPCAGENLKGIHCIGCDAFMSTGWFEASDEYIGKIWNRRAGDDASH